MQRLFIKWRVCLEKNVLHPVTQTLQNGTSPHEVTLTLVLGILISLIPVFGVSTIILTAIALRMRLNLIIIQAANFVVYPMQVLLYIPFIKLGLLLYPSENAPETFQEFVMLAKDSQTEAMIYFGSATFFAMVAWLIVCIPLGFILYNIFYRAFTKFIQIRSSGYLKDTSA